MARFRLSRSAEADVVHILATSADRWGIDGRRRYAAVLAAAMRKVAAEPESPGTWDRSELLHGLRSLHLRNARADDPEAKVRRPVHVVYYRVLRPALVEVVRVSHERMEPSRHIGSGSED